jgi:hypothetical protein
MSGYARHSRIASRGTASQCLSLFEYEKFSDTFDGEFPALTRYLFLSDWLDHAIHHLRNGFISIPHHALSCTTLV